MASLMSNFGELSLVSDAKRRRELAQHAFITGRPPSQTVVEGSIRPQLENELRLKQGVLANAQRIKAEKDLQDQRIAENARQFDTSFELETRKQGFLEQQAEFENQQKRKARKEAEVSTFEAIVNNICFITTAVCESAGKADDCEELEVLRRYRDGWLMENHPDDISTYYEIAPGIVEAISQKENSAEIWEKVNSKYIQPCVRLIKEGEYDKAYEGYKAMVGELVKENSDG